MTLHQQLFGVTLPCRCHRNSVTHHALFIDNNSGPIGDAFIFEIHTIFLGRISFGVKVLKQWEGYAAQRLCPVVMGESAVDANTQNLGVAALELAFDRFESRNLLASSRCPIQWIEHQHDVFLAFELAQRKLGSSQVAHKLKIRRLLSNSDHDDFFLLI